MSPLDVHIGRIVSSFVMLYPPGGLSGRENQVGYLQISLVLAPHSN